MVKAKIKKICLVVKKEAYKKDPLFDYLKNNLKILKSPKNADAIFVLGGDGTMLKSIRQYRKFNLPFYGFNFGHVGFLMNKSKIEAAKEIIQGKDEKITAKMLQASLYNKQGEKIKTEFAFNDFYFERYDASIAKIKITVNQKLKFDSLVCDGVIVSASAGSTAYNASAGGVVLPIGTNAMVLTAISPAVFYKWRSAQLAEGTKVMLENVGEKKSVRFMSDGVKIANVNKAIISYSDKLVKIGFAASQNFHDKVLKLQFNQH